MGKIAKREILKEKIAAVILMTQAHARIQNTDKASGKKLTKAGKTNTISYDINHYKGETYLDTLAINWDTRSGDSRATLRQAGEVKEFVAIGAKGGVRVTTSAQRLWNRPETVMLYK